LFDAALESASLVMQPPKGKAILVKLSGARTETYFFKKGGFCPFLVGKISRKKGEFE
jgi:hypothetical protein